MNIFRRLLSKRIGVALASVFAGALSQKLGITEAEGTAVIIGAVNVVGATATKLYDEWKASKKPKP